MKTAKINKIKNIKHIPTELNYFYNLNTRIIKIRKQGNTSRLLIIALIIWNMVLTINLIHPQINSPIPQFTDAENELIMQLEGIPTGHIIIGDKTNELL